MKVGSGFRTRCAVSAGPGSWIGRSAPSGSAVDILRAIRLSRSFGARWCRFGRQLIRCAEPVALVIGHGAIIVSARTIPCSRSCGLLGRGPAEDRAAGERDAHRALPKRRHIAQPLHGHIARSVTTLNEQVTALEEQVRRHFGRHPDAEIYLFQLDMGAILGAQVLGEFGDDPSRYADGKARGNYAAASPITRASGKKKIVAARWIHNDRLLDALMSWAFSSLIASPGARAFYDEDRKSVV